MKNIFSPILLLLAALACAQTTPRLKVEILEVGRNPKTKPAVLADGAVFDTKSNLRVEMSAASLTRESNPVIQDLEALKAALVSTSTQLKAVDLGALSPEVRLSRVAELLKPIVDANQKILSVARVPSDPNYQLVIRLRREYGQWMGARNPGLIETATKMSEIGINFVTQAVVVGPEIEIPATLTYSQRALVRVGRTYGDNPLTLLNLSENDKALLERMRQLDLANAVKEIVNKKVEEVRTTIANAIDAEIAKVKAVLGDRHPELIAKIEADLKAFQSLTIDSVKNDPHQLTTMVSTLLEDVNALKTAIGDQAGQLTAAIKALYDTVVLQKAVIENGVNDIIEALTNAQELAETLTKKIDLIIGRTKMSYLIGSQADDAQKMDLSTSFQNNDVVRIQVVSKDGANEGAKETKEADLTLYAYKVGANWVRTITYDYLRQEGSSAWLSSPAVNVTYKSFGRNRFKNTWGSVGFGITMFPTGINQSGNGKIESGFGMSLSLLDDWLSVGYGKNFTSNKWFPFVGLMVPFKF